jgi:hypothetical protein
LTTIAAGALDRPASVLGGCGAICPEGWEVDTGSI